MDIERPASNAVTGPTPEAAGLASQKSALAPSAPAGRDSEKSSRGPKPQSFREVEGMEQSDLDSMIGDQPHTKKSGRGELGSDEGEDDEGDDDDDLDTEDADELEEGEDTEGGDDTDDEEDTDEEQDPDDIEEDEEDEETEEEVPELTPEEQAKESELHEVKVDGKVRKYTLAQLKNMVSSGAHTLQKRKEFDAYVAKTQNQIGSRQKQLQNIDAAVTPAWKALKEGKISDAIYALAETNKMNTLDVRRKLRQDMIPVVAARLGLHQNFVDARIKAMESHNRMVDTDEENRFLKGNQERFTKESQKKPDPVAEQMEVLKAEQLKHGVSVKELDEVGKWLNQQHGGDDKIPLHTPQQLIQIALNRRICDTAVRVISEKRPRLVKDQKFVDRTVRKLFNNPAWTPLRLGRWVEKQARKLAEASKPNESTLHKEISRKALKGGKARYENPRRSQKKALKFSDVGSDDLP